MAYLLIDGENFKRKMAAVLRPSDGGRPLWHEYNFKGLVDKVLKDIKIERAVFLLC